MDKAAFESACTADGFGAVQEKEGRAGFTARPHTHPFDVRVLVMEGEFTLIRGEESRTYRCGDSFAMDAHCEHAESFGPGGARYLAATRGG